MENRLCSYNTRWWAGLKIVSSKLRQSYKVSRTLSMCYVLFLSIAVKSMLQAESFRKSDTVCVWRASVHPDHPTCMKLICTSDFSNVKPKCPTVFYRLVSSYVICNWFNLVILFIRTVINGVLSLPKKLINSARNCDFTMTGIDDHHKWSVLLIGMMFKLWSIVSAFCTQHLNACNYTNYIANSSLNSFFCLFVYFKSSQCS